MIARALLLLTTVALGVAGCNKSGASAGQVCLDLRHQSDGKGTPVARFSGDAITAEELQKRFAEMSPFARASYQATEQRQEYLDGLVRFELLAAEAVKRGLASSPEVRDATKKVLVQQLLKQELEEKAHGPVDDAAVARYYEAHLGDFKKPEMVHLAHLFIAGPKADPAARAAGKKKIDELFARAKALPPHDLTGFGQLARDHSQDPTSQPLEGDLRYLSLEDLKSKHGPEVAEAAASMREVGQLFDKVVETEKGFHLLKLRGRQAALNLEQEQVKNQIRNILLHEKKMAHYNTLLDGLKKSSSYTVDTAALAKVSVDPKAATAPASGPPPGFIPSPSGQQPPIR
jgi:peptidyl-prolyl cis-trans isomerase C